MRPPRRVHTWAVSRSCRRPPFSRKSCASPSAECLAVQSGAGGRCEAGSQAASLLQVDHLTLGTDVRLERRKLFDVGRWVAPAPFGPDHPFDEALEPSHSFRALTLDLD